MVAVVFDSRNVQATSCADADGYNHALKSCGGVATASGSTGSNAPSNANDGSTSTYWQSSSTTGWLAVAFPAYAYINTVRVRFTTTSKVYPSLSLYYDLNGNGKYESTEKVWTTTSNGKLDVYMPTPTKLSLGVNVTIDNKVGSTQPTIAELGAYLQNDTDGDGLTNDQEVSTVYYQDMKPAGLPAAIPDDGVNATSSSVSLAQFSGIPVLALANFSVNHARKTDLTAQIGYWNGSAWIDRYVWDPGHRLDEVSLLQPLANSYVTGTVTVDAAVQHPEITSKVEFRIAGVLQATVTVPVGSDYRWSWNTTGFAEGPTKVNATQYDTAGGQAWSEITVNVVQAPQTTWISPTNGATVSDGVTVKVTATDYYGINSVYFYVDGLYKAQVLSPNSGTNGYAWTWSTSGYCTNAQHTLSTVVTAGAPLYLKSSPSVTVTANTYPLVCITSPADGAYISGVRSVVASPTAASGKSISKVDFYLSGSLQYTATSSPWAWSWNTTTTGDGTYTVSVIATDSASKTASAAITVHVLNGGGGGGGGGCRIACPTGPIGASDSSAPAGSSSTPSAALGILASDWVRGELDAGTTATVVVDLVYPQTSASASENASRILRPAFPLSTFTTYLQWRLVIRDWSKGTGGNVTGFTLRFEMKSDPNNPDTDGDSIPDGVEVNKWHTLPVARDSDLDGLTDDYETTPHSETVTVNGVTTILAPFTTDPTKWDTDGDGLSDGQERGFVSVGMTKTIGEVGTVSNVATFATTTVYLRNHYTAPVVIAEPASYHNTAMVHMRVSNVTDHSFQIKLEPWGSCGIGGCTYESAAYLVLESGDFVLPDGSQVEAGIAAGVGLTPVTVPFREAFGAGAPILLVQTQTLNDAHPAVANRTYLNWTGSYGVRLNANASTSHSAESVGYVAISAPSNPRALSTWTRAEASFSSSQLQGTWTYPSTFTQPQAPLIVGWMGPEAASPTRNLGLRQASATNVSVTIYREQYGTPTADKVEFFAFAGPMNLTARMTTKANGTGSFDTDADGLSDGVEVNTYGSNPTMRDTDADGLPDNVEVATRNATIPINGTLKTISYTTSPTSPDTDGDGIPDLQEIQGVYDHRVLYYDMSTVVSGTTAIMQDLSGNINEGTEHLVGNVTGKVGGAKSFTTNEYITAADATSLNLADSLTFASWVYPTAISNGVDYEIVRKISNNPTKGYLFRVHGDGTNVGHLNVEIWNNGVKSAWNSPNGGVGLNKWQYATFTLTDGVGQFYLNGTAVTTTEVTVGPAVPQATGSPVFVGASEGLNEWFSGYLDEVQVWDRAQSKGEVSGLYNVTSGTSYVARLDMETRASNGQLFDFSGTGHTGALTGTSPVEGRTGLARKFAGGSDGVLLSNSGTLTISSAVTVDVNVNLAADPSTDVSLVARKGSFYLNVSSDGLVRWTLSGKASIATTVPIALARWVRVTVTATTSTLNLYMDGALVASGTTSAFPSTTNGITAGYTEGQAHLAGSLDEFTLMSSAASATTVTDSGPRGVQLNPAVADTDGDGLSDGLESFTTTAKLANRYPFGAYNNIYPPALSLNLSVPGWSITQATALVGITAPFITWIAVNLAVYKSGVLQTTYTIRPYGLGGWTANNFTSFDLLAVGVSRVDLARPSMSFAIQVFNSGGSPGQLEYFQIQVTAHTLPNRADTDRDGLNDSEEVNLGHDGYMTNPWKADTDGDGISDTMETNGWSWSGSTIVSDPNGFKTDPTRADTDRDGVPDGRDRAPLGDAFVRIFFQTAVIYGGTDDDTTPSFFEPFASIHVGNETAYTPNKSVASGSTAYIAFTYVANVPDDQTYIPITIEVWDYDAVQANGYPDDTHERFAVNGTSPTWTLNHPLASTGPQAYSSSGTGAFRATSVSLTVETVYPSRIAAYMIVPLDYSGVYNVTNANGAIVSRRYVGEPRLVTMILNITRVVGRATLVYQDVLFVPRSVFFDTMLYERLANANTSWPLTNLAFRQNDTKAGSNADDLQQILSGNVTYDDETAILGLLYLNTASTATYQLVNIDYGASQDTLFTYSLSDGALRLIGYTPFVVDSSVRYRFCSSPNCGVNPVDKPWWEQIWDGFVSVVTAFVTSAIVLAVNAFAQLVTILSQLGSWVADQFAQLPGKVASAVQAAAKVLNEVWDSFINLITAPFRAFLAYLENWRLRLVSASFDLSALSLHADGSPGSMSNVGGAITQLLRAIFDPGILTALGIAAAGIIAALVASMATGIGYAIASLVAPILISLVISVVVQAVAPAIGAALSWLSDLVASTNWMTVGLGVSILSLALILLEPFVTATTISFFAMVTDEVSFVDFVWGRITIMEIPSVKSIMLSLLGVILAAIPLILGLKGYVALLLDVPALILGFVGLATAEKDPAHPIFGKVEDRLADVGIILGAGSVIADLAAGPKG
ncbi:MAG TPA: LamG-like jellyroll fold domain-containing protein [Thermoplasmata archaeon]|nr:LamG-like jellyroll fold domain-containing protein [Thermoplasmata archaeon]